MLAELTLGWLKAEALSTFFAITDAVHVIGAICLIAAAALLEVVIVY